MFAWKLISLGKMRCPRPCRARNATRFPSSVPSTSASEGSPNGVFTRTSRVSVNPLMAYRPLPPMIPMDACAAFALLFPFFAFFAAIRSPLVQSAAFQDLVNRCERVFLAVRHFARQLRQPCLAARSAQRPFNQARFEQVNQPRLPMLHVLPLPLSTGFE